MPIIPRFASVQDPNTPPNVDFSQGIMQSALAGAQLRRMGVEEKQADAAGKRADAGLALQQERMGFERQDRAKTAAFEEGQAKAAGYLLDAENNGSPAANPYQQGPAGEQQQMSPASDTEFDDNEIAAAQNFAKTLPADVQPGFLDGIQKLVNTRKIKRGTTAVTEMLQDAFVDSQAAEPEVGTKFASAFESFKVQLDTLDTLPPEKQALLIQGISQGIAQTRMLMNQEDERLREIPKAMAEVEEALTLIANDTQHPNYGSMQSLLSQLRNSRSTVKPNEIREELRGLKAGLTRYKFKDAQGNDQEAWVTPEQKATLTQRQIEADQREAARIEQARSRNSMRILNTMTTMAQLGVRGQEAANQKRNLELQTEKASKPSQYQIKPIDIDRRMKSINDDEIPEGMTKREYAIQQLAEEAGSGGVSAPSSGGPRNAEEEAFLKSLGG